MTYLAIFAIELVGQAFMGLTLGASIAWGDEIGWRQNDNRRRRNHQARPMIRAALSRVMSLLRKPDTTAEDAERAVMLTEWMDSANRRQALLDERASIGETDD